MIQPNLQQTLFSTYKNEALIIANTTEAIATQWYNQKYLSFDIAHTDELQNSQVLELRFISKLFSSIFSLEAIEIMLSKLHKPYSYEYSDIYFDVFSGEWKNLSEEIGEEDEVDEVDVCNKYLQNLDPESDREEIERIIEELQAKLI